MFAGAYWLAHSPMVSGIYGDDKNRAPLARRSARLPDATCPDHPVLTALVRTAPRARLSGP